MTGCSFPFIVWHEPLERVFFFSFSNYNAANALVTSSSRRLVRLIHLAYVASYNEKWFESDFSGIEHVFMRQITLIESRFCHCALRRSHVYTAFRPRYASTAWKVAANLAVGYCCSLNDALWTKLVRASTGNKPSVVPSCVRPEVPILSSAEP